MIQGQIHEKLKTLVSKEGKLSGHEAIKVIVNRVWLKYDSDKSGQLSKHETKMFVLDILDQVGEHDLFGDEAFDDIFE